MALLVFGAGVPDKPDPETPSNPAPFQRIVIIRKFREAMHEEGVQPFQNAWGHPRRYAGRQTRLRASRYAARGDMRSPTSGDNAGKTVRLAEDFGSVAGTSRKKIPASRSSCDTVPRTIPRTSSSKQMNNLS